MMEFTAIHPKCNQRAVGTQKVFPNAVFDLLNGGYYAPNDMFGFPSEEDVHLPIPIPDGS